MKLTAINSLEDVKEFVRILIEEENLNFHPDTPFEDYINLNTNQPTYSEEEVVLRNQLLHQAFALDDRFAVDTRELICEFGLQLTFENHRKF